MTAPLFNRRHFTACLLALSGAGFVRPSLAAGRSPKLLVLGDSLSAEYGLPRGTGWASLLAQQLRDDKLDATLVIASISGARLLQSRDRFKPFSRIASAIRAPLPHRAA